MACAPVVHAVAGARFGPAAPQRIEICPAARLTIAAVIKNGETRPGPWFVSFACSRSMASKPPTPLPTKTPTRSGCSAFISRPACRTANSVAAMAKWMNRAVFLTSFFSTKSRGSKAGTSPAIRQGKGVASKSVTGPIPERPAKMAFQAFSVPIPVGQMSPIPVTTTRRPLPIGSILSGLSRVHQKRPLGLRERGVNARIRFATDDGFSGGKSRLAILPRVNGIQFVDKPLLRHSPT